MMDKAKMLDLLVKKRFQAHQILFPHRHKEEWAPYHIDVVERMHDAGARDIFNIFRNGAKSTLAEEARIIRALFREFTNSVIIGSSWNKACERLGSIKHELETNELILQLFGDQVGKTWTEDRIILKNGVIIQAYGRGQSIRGSKHHSDRPNDCLCDDFEDEETTRTEDSIRRCLVWFFKVLMPALEKGANVDIIGTPMDPQSVLVQLMDDPEWRTTTVGIKYLDEEGQWKPSWPAKYPIEYVNELEAKYARKGMLTEFAQEYMGKAEDEKTKAFSAGMVKVEPRVRVWEPVYSVHDPARTTKEKTSAQTGAVQFSWVGNRLIVWDAYGRFWKPDEIYDDIFRVQQEYQPVEIGVEEDSLNEFIMQPLRGEMLRRGVPIPLKPLKAPHNKLGFIKGLAPYFKAGEIIFAKELPELKAQLLNYPNGLIDILNALAYAPKMRPGIVIYEDFSTANVQEEILLQHGGAWLALNCTDSLTTGVLVQYKDGVMNLLADWVEEGDAGARLKGIVESAKLECGDLRLRAGPMHFDKYRNKGLLQAARASGMELHRGGEEYRGREKIREFLVMQKKGFPCIQVSTRARWTLNALSGGYAKDVQKNNMLADTAVNNHYKVLMEGLESFCAVINSGVDKDEDNEVHYAMTPDGREYKSLRPDAYMRGTTKDYNSLLSGKR